MSLARSVERSKFLKEVLSELHEEYFGIIQKKYLPTTDNIYTSVFIKDDGNEYTLVKLRPLLELLEERKQEAKDKREAIPFSNGLVITLKGAKKGYNICLTEEDIYDIFFNTSKLPNKQTNRIQTQLRAFGLWTRLVDDVLNESYEKIETVLKEYGLEISHVQENRIDFCYHTNIKADIDKIFDREKGERKKIKTRLKKGFSQFEIVAREDGTDFEHTYYMFGQQDSSWCLRIYDKVREVIEMGYKGFFFELWHKNGLISYYDKFCMEYAFPHRDVDYLHKGRLAFYVEHGTDPERRKKYEDALNTPSKSLKEIKRMANEFMPPTTAVTNIEFQTRRDFYSKSDEFIDEWKTLERDTHPNLTRLYRILDNREVFLNYLHGKGFSFQEGTEEGEPIYSDWWNRLRNTKVGGIKANEELLRKYAHKLDKETVQMQGLKKIASYNVYTDCNGANGFEECINYISSLTDNKAHEMDALLKNTKAYELKLEAEYQMMKKKQELRLKNRKLNAAAEQAATEKEKVKDRKIVKEQTNGYVEVKDKDFTQAEIIKDSLGIRWVKCEICGTVKTASKFISYGGRGSENIGKCKDCSELVAEDYTSAQVPDWK